ncbi:MAG: Coenzyme F420 hydrogenase/dehydrogenase, beta subunit C-terminal domain [Acidimicrobiia bacterium]|nr:Coenzyme F420 hydrogenase/dehydrogenase, beta subunit C-terminal domain [Acidimicrobiia bacterium]
MNNPTTPTPPSAAPKKERWKANWSQLWEEVVDTEICTGCSGCIVACPKNVLTLDDGWHPALHRDAWHESDPSTCTHGERGCTLCTRACPRFRAWEPQADIHLHGRQRNPDAPEEVAGIYKSLLLLNATDPNITRQGQDGGFVSALLIYCLERGYIDAALVSYVDDEWNARPGVAWTRDDVLRAAGSRYTYSSNLAAYAEAIEEGAEKIALVGMGCQSSVAPIMMERGVRKAGKRIALNIGLLCSKTFSEDFLDGLLLDRYGLERRDITRMDIKGVLQLQLREGINEENYLEVPLKECHAFTRLGCTTCPDFSAEHADISVGGIGGFDNRSLAVVRTDYGAQLIDEMVRAELLEMADAFADDPKAVKLLNILSKGSRKRWPVSVESGRPEEHAAPGLLPS